MVALRLLKLLHATATSIFGLDQKTKERDVLAGHIIPSTKVLDLLLSMISQDMSISSHGSVTRNDFLLAVEGRGKWPSLVSLSALMDKVVRGWTREEIVEIMKIAKSFPEYAYFIPMIDNQVRWFVGNVALAFGSDFVEATYDLHITKRKLGVGVQEFILANPARFIHHDRWVKKKRLMLTADPSRSPSILLFHGTQLKNFLNILRKGFHGAADRRYGYGLFMSELPDVATAYAIARTAQYDSPRREQWENDPWKGYGLLLGCEVLGKGRLVNENGKVHVIKEFDTVMPRYLFLIPPAEIWGNTALSRARMEPTMKSAFEKIERGLESKYYEPEPEPEQAIHPRDESGAWGLEFAMAIIAGFLRYLVLRPVLALTVALAVVAWFWPHLILAIVVFCLRRL